MESEVKTSIQLRFIRGTSWDSRLIEFRMRSWCSHVEAIIPNEPYSFGAMLSGGVRRRSFFDRTYKHVSKCEVWEIPCGPTERFAFWNFLQHQSGKPYDWRAIVSFGFGERDWTEPDSWFCSELMVAAAIAAGLWRFSGQAHIDRIDPGVAYLLFTSLIGAKCILNAIS